jgi:HEAT repeat protein
VQDPLTEPIIGILDRLATTDPDSTVRTTAASTLAGRGVLIETVLAVLAGLATDPDPGPRRQVTSALGSRHLPAEPVAAILTSLLSDDQVQVRIDAASALARRGDLTESVVTVLTDDAIHHQSWSTRHTATKMLERAAPTAAVRGRLLELLLDEDDDVRRSAGSSLVEMSRRHPQVAAGIRDDLARACTDPALSTRDGIDKRTGWDYAQEALTAHVAALGPVT